MSEFWENLEAYWQANGTVIHEGLRREMLETIAEIEARSNMPLPDEERDGNREAEKNGASGSIAPALTKSLSSVCCGCRLELFSEEV